MQFGYWENRRRLKYNTYKIICPVHIFRLTKSKLIFLVKMQSFAYLNRNIYLSWLVRIHHIQWEWQEDIWIFDTIAMKSKVWDNGIISFKTQILSSMTLIQFFSFIILHNLDKHNLWYKKLYKYGTRREVIYKDAMDNTNLYFEQGLSLYLNHEAATHLFPQCLEISIS